MLEAMRTTLLCAFNFRLCFLHTQERNQQAQIKFSQLDERTERSILTSGLSVSTERPEQSLFLCSQKLKIEGIQNRYFFFTFTSLFLFKLNT